MQKKRLATLATLIAGLTIITLLTVTRRVPADDARIMGIVFTCILLWATSVIPGLLVSLLFFFLSTVGTTVPPEQIFSGFASSAFWLVFSGAVIGFALKDSGLGERIGALLARHIGGSYLNALVAFAVLAFLLSLVMPSTFGRIAILVPITLGYCRAVRLDEAGNGQRGLLLLVVVGSYELAAAVLPANLPNVIMAGILEQSQGIPLGFSEFLFYFFPAGVLVRGGVLVAVSYKLFGDTIGPTGIADSPAPISRRELHVLVLLVITLAFWFTDSLHHIAPGWVGLGFTIAYFLTSPPAQLARFTSTFKMDLLWFIAAIIGLTALVHHIDLRSLNVFEGVPLATHPLLIYGSLVATSIALCFLVTSNAAPALFVPIATQILQNGALLKMGMLSQAMGYSTTFFPYQSPPVVFGTELARIDHSAAIKYCLATAMLGLLFVVPVNAMWWRLIGLL